MLALCLRWPAMRASAITISRAPLLYSCSVLVGPDRPRRPPGARARRGAWAATLDPGVRERTERKRAWVRRPAGRPAFSAIPRQLSRKYNSWRVPFASDATPKTHTRVLSY
jgi:hypothetical protein